MPVLFDGLQLSLHLEKLSSFPDLEFYGMINITLDCDCAQSLKTLGSIRKLGFMQNHCYVILNLACVAPFWASKDHPMSWSYRIENFAWSSPFVKMLASCLLLATLLSQIPLLSPAFLQNQKHLIVVCSVHRVIFGTVAK
jgi:hypothetical protein